MNIWLKIAIVIAVVVVLIVLAVVVVPIVLTGKFLPSGQKSQQPEKTFYDVAKEDDARLRAEPTLKDTTKPLTPAQQNEPQPVAEVKLKFKELSEEEQVAAEQLFEMALVGRKIGRLPGLTYGQMVDYCRRIIQRFPGSEFDFKARRMLVDIPEQYRDQYKITADEIDLSKWPRQ